MAYKDLFSPAAENEDVPFWRRGNITAEGLARLKLELERLKGQVALLRDGHAGCEVPAADAVSVRASCMKLVQMGSGAYEFAHFDFEYREWHVIGGGSMEFGVDRWWDLR